MIHNGNPGHDTNINRNSQSVKRYFEGIRKMNPKPFKNCGGCKDFKEKCHCLCHVELNCPGYHEIIYGSGELQRSGFIMRLFHRLRKDSYV